MLTTFDKLAGRSTATGKAADTKGMGLSSEDAQMSADAVLEWAMDADEQVNREFYRLEESDSVEQISADIVNLMQLAMRIDAGAIYGEQDEVARARWALRGLDDNFSELREFQATLAASRQLAARRSEMATGDDTD